MTITPRGGDVRVAPVRRGEAGHDSHHPCQFSTMTATAGSGDDHRTSGGWPGGFHGAVPAHVANGLR